MGWIEDSIEVFRKLPPAGKVAVGGAAVGVAILAYAHYRSSGGSASAATSPNATNSSLSGLGVPSLASSPADWANWFSNGLAIPATPTQTSDGAPASVTTPGTSSNPIATFTAPAGAVAAAATSDASASAHVATSASAPVPDIQNPTIAQTLAHIAGPIPSYPIQNPTVAQTAAHVGTLAPVNPSFIPTTIRPLPTPGRGRVA